MDRRDFLRAAVSTGALAAAQAVSTTSTAYAASTGGEGRRPRRESPGLRSGREDDPGAPAGDGLRPLDGRTPSPRPTSRASSGSIAGARALSSIIETNPDALAVAEALDRERQREGARGPLHGIPVLLKDNIDTADRMATTAGSLALVGVDPAPRTRSWSQRLREAGAVILGKTNLSEWANFRSHESTSGWSGRGGQ